jgi:hypothetical protein
LGGLAGFTLYHVQVGIIKFAIEAALEVLGDNGVFVFLAFVQKGQFEGNYVIVEDQAVFGP